ncbi:MAG: ATP-dependent helicase [Candidatus Omnitrophica bacterium]|nr:ATP-dependent helicase [Candidatus Omnitrophota bacterium]
MKKYPLEGFTTPHIVTFENNLNPQQLKVVLEGDGPALVLAGAGSGKTRVLIYRLAYLLEKGISPREILLVTFTNKAASEMLHRAESLLKRTLGDLWSGTFHHVGNVILRKEANALGYSANFTILDREDSLDFFDDCIEELGFDRKEKLFPKKNVISNIWTLSVNSLKDIEKVIGEFYPHLEEFIPPIKKVIHTYRKKKKEANVMDFSDLLYGWLTLMQEDTLAKKYSGLFRYILVDEYQDTNRIQFELLKKISSFHKNILVVGDDAQSIYSFRAADINNLLEFPKTFANANVFKLETNYRSTPQILQLANQIIKQNMNQFPKELKAVKKDGALPAIVKTKDVYAQAHFVAQRILELAREGLMLEKIAVLFRSRFQALELEMELLKRNIPYVVRGGMRFFEQAHIKDVISYLKYEMNPRDELSFKRAICLHRAIGRGYASKIYYKHSQENKNFEVILNELPKKQKESMKEFTDILKEIRKSSSAEEAIRTIIKSYHDYCYLSFDNPEDRIQDLEELAKMAHSYSSIKDFLLDLGSYEEFKGETVLNARNDNGLLVLSTIHQAKGLEWNVVFFIGFCDYEFPHPKSLGTPQALEEERRLFYVTATRAKDELYIVYPETKYTYRNGLILTRASQFYWELPPACFEEWETTENPQDLF